MGGGLPSAALGGRIYGKVVKLVVVVAPRFHNCIIYNVHTKEVYF